MTATQTLALTWGFLIAIVALLGALIWRDFIRPHKQTPEEVAESIAAILNEAQMYVEPCPFGGIRVCRFPTNWDADNVASGNTIIPSGGGA
jgi:hypothetical protein